MPDADRTLSSFSVASGNLVNDFDVTSDNEVGQMLLALKDMNDSLRAIVGNVREGVDTINAAASDIASGNADVSARLESQASNLEETASSLEQLTSTVKQNSDNAQQANALMLRTAVFEALGLTLFEGGKPESSRSFIGRAASPLIVGWLRYRA